MKKLLSIVVLVCIVMSMCTVSAWADVLPTAVIRDIDVAGLTFAKEFEAGNIGSGYEDWIADFDVTISGINGTATFNSDGSKDGYLWGHYDFAGSMTVPGEDVPVDDGQTVRLIKSVGYKFPVEFMFNTVKVFQCGMFFTDDFLLKNPNLKITLKLVIYDPNNESNEFVIDESEYTNPLYTPPAPPAPVTPAAPVVEDIYYIPATDDNSNMALWSILALALLSTAFVTRKRKNEN